MEKVIESHMSRKFTVESSKPYGENTHLTVENTAYHDQIISTLRNETAVELGEALIKAAGKRTFIYEGRCPSASGDGKTFVKAGNTTLSLSTDPDDVLTMIKELITIHEVLILEAEEKKKREAKEAQEALKIKLRRDNLTKEFCGSNEAGYVHLSDTAKKAVDRVIELEDKLEAKDA